jgi:hypothetical protein
MRRLVVLFGLIIIAVGIVAIVWPEQSFAVVLHWPAEVLLFVAVAVRVVLGVVLILAAPHCRFPKTMYVLGVVYLIGALVIGLLGTSRLQSLGQWWFHQPPMFLQFAYAAVVILGAFLVYAGSGQARNEQRNPPSLRLPDD